MKVTLGSHPLANEDLDRLHARYNQYGIEVERIEAKETDAIFHRDVFAWTPFGLIKARMGKRSRFYEPDDWFEHTGITPAFEVTEGTFEGADLLWINDKLALVGLGDRTNAFGAREVAEWLNSKGVMCYVVSLPMTHHQHLLGVVNTFCGQLFMTREMGNLPPIVARQYFIPSGYKSVNFVVHGDVVFTSDSNSEANRYLASCGALIEALPTQNLFRYHGGIACATGIVDMEIQSCREGGVAGSTEYLNT